MRETRIFNYFVFGYNYHSLRFALKGRPARGKKAPALETFIDKFLAELNELDLEVTQVAANDLRKIREGLDELPEDAIVDEELAARVKKAVDHLDGTLDAELSLKTAFVVTPKRFQLDHLLGAPQEIFGAGIFRKLPAISQFDFTEACKAIAFGLPTGGAFHLMRGVEGVLRYYYCSIVKRDRVKALWGPMVDHLRRRRDSPPRGLLDNLDNIRVNFRNPTQHPEARYDMDEVQDLLSVSIDCVNRMIRDVAKRSK